MVAPSAAAAAAAAAEAAASAAAATAAALAAEAAAHHRATVLSYYRQLLRLTARLDPEKGAAARNEARDTLRARRGEADPVAAQQHAKELAARVSFLRMTTPRPAGEPLGGGRFVFRNGEWKEGEGESKGERVADGSMSMDEAKRRNAADYRRFYGKPLPKKMFF